MKVGNIVNCSEEIDERYFNCLSIDEFVGNDEISKLPTLIVGWDTVKKNFGDVSILSKVITPSTDDGYGGVFWTFSRKEKRGIYELNLKEFKERCYEDLVKNLKTYNIDPIIYKINDTDELCTRILKLADGVGYLFQDRIVYIYKDDHIFMIDLELMEFIGFNKEQIVETLTNNLNVFGDDFEEKYTEELKHLDIKYIPFLEFRIEYKTLLLASFVNKNDIHEFLLNLSTNYGTDSNKVFVFSLDGDTHLLTYKIKIDLDIRFDIRRELPKTIQIHKKKLTFFTINALNKLIERDSGLEPGNINHREHQVDWTEYENKLILINGGKLEISDITRVFLSDL